MLCTTGKTRHKIRTSLFQSGRVVDQLCGPFWEGSGVPKLICKGVHIVSGKQVGFTPQRRNTIVTAHTKKLIS